MPCSLTLRGARESVIVRDRLCHPRSSSGARGFPRDALTSLSAPFRVWRIRPVGGSIAIQLSEIRDSSQRAIGTFW